MRKNVFVVALVLLVALVGCAEHEHSWKVISTTEPTCLVEGENVFKCEGCGATRTESIASLGHEWDDSVLQDSTCSKTGREYKVCKRCHEEFTVAEIPLKTHSFSEWTKNTSTNGMERKCSVCGYEENTIDLSFLEAYKADASVVPEGFSYTDSHSDANNPEIVEREVRISSKEALLYYAYKFDKEAAFNVCTNHGGTAGDSYCVWYRNTYINSGHKFVTNVYLDCDIDFENEILPHGMEIYGTVFNGQGHTIKNVRIYGSSEYNGNAGLFYLGEGGNAYYASLENFNVENVHAETSTKYYENAHTGIVVAIGTTSISNVKVENSSAVGGKYTGAIAGFVDGGSIAACSVKNCTVSGQYKIGGVVGQIGAGAGDVKENFLTNVEIKVENLIEGKESAVVGKVVGDYNCKGECSGNSFDGTLPEGYESWIGKIETGREVVENN